MLRKIVLVAALALTLVSMLIPEQRTAPYLREAAARYQADLLLVMQPSCRSFERYRVLRSEQSRAWCVVEAVLLDLRTGLVPFVATATQNFDAEQSPDDFGFRETILRAQIDALDEALAEISGAVTVFLDQSAAGA